MIKLFNIYKGKLLGILITIIGITLFIGTLTYLMPKPFKSEPITYFTNIKITFKYTSLMVMGVVMWVIGISFILKDSSSRNLVNNIKEAFKKDK